MVDGKAFRPVSSGDRKLVGFVGVGTVGNPLRKNKFIKSLTALRKRAVDGALKEDLAAQDPMKTRVTQIPKGVRERTDPAVLPQVMQVHAPAVEHHDKKDHDDVSPRHDIRVRIRT